MASCRRLNLCFCAMRTLSECPLGSKADIERELGDRPLQSVAFACTVLSISNIFLAQRTILSQFFQGLSLP
jgi:hypothetical protein